MGLTVDRLHVQEGGEDATGKILGARNKYGEVAWKTAGDLGLMTPPVQKFPAWVAVGSGVFSSADGTGTWLLGGQGKVKSTVQGDRAAEVFQWNPADFPNPVSLIMGARLAMNGLAPGVTVVISLREITLGGNANQIAYTHGALSTADSTHTYTPAELGAASALTLAKGITKPNNSALYGVCVTISGTWLANSAFAITAGVQWMPF